MEIVEGEATKVDRMRENRKHKKLTIDDYLDFIHDRTHELTAKQLREIIGMHGFKKIKVKKSTLMDIITSMDLMDLRRSTLPNGDVSGGASLKLEEVTSDLKNLDWQECHVTSLLTLGAVAPAASASASTAPVKREIAKECHVISDLLSGDAAVPAVSVKRKVNKKCHVTSPTAKGAVTPAVPAKPKRAKERLDYSALHTEGTTEVPVKPKVAKKRRLSSVLAECADVPAVSASGEGGAVAVKRKRPKGLGMKPTKAAVDGCVVCSGTTVAAGSTTEG